MAIANRAKSAIFNGLGAFVKSAKSFDLAFKMKKIKTKYKSFGSGLGGKINIYHLP
tara:strand:+ start:256 stop:423 length:168 start_codon:yes stop_codon:yes gene_type:complete